MGYQETDTICDDEKQCRCVIESEGCKSASCVTEAGNGMCIGNSFIRFNSRCMEEKYFGRQRRFTKKFLEPSYFPLCKFF